MKRDNSLQVYYNERLVGTLAMTAIRKTIRKYSKKSLKIIFCRNKHLVF